MMREIGVYDKENIRLNPSNKAKIVTRPAENVLIANVAFCATEVEKNSYGV